MSTVQTPVSAKSDTSSSGFRSTDDVYLYSLMPWSIVFEFNSGQDAMRAMMASKNFNPWKLSHIEHAMKERLKASDIGKDWLDQYGETSTLLPKLVYCLENDCVCQVDGVYQSFLAGSGLPGSLREYLRFYSDGTVISAISSATPGEISGWFHREHVGISPGEYSTDVAQNGPGLVNVSFEIPLPDPNGTIVYSGFIKSDGGLFLTSTRGVRNYHFVPW